MKQGRVAEAKAVMRRLHGGGPAAGQRNDEIDREVDSMGGNKGEEQKGDVAWAEVRTSNAKPQFPLLQGVRARL